VQASTQRVGSTVEKAAAGQLNLKHTQNGTPRFAHPPTPSSTRGRMHSAGSFAMGDADGADSEYSELLHASEVLRGRVHGLENEQSELRELLAREREERLQEHRQREQ